MFLGHRLGAMPFEIHWRAGSEFFVHKSRISAHPRKFYLEILAFILEYERDMINRGVTPTNDDASKDIAVAFERLWPYIFSK